jgi:hypothetical protein
MPSSAYRRGSFSKILFCIARLRINYERNFFSYELAGSACVSLVVLYILIDSPEIINIALKDIRALLYPAFISLYGALVGFIMATIAILVSFSNTKKFKKFQETPGYRHFFSTYTIMIWYLSVLLFLSVRMESEASLHFSNARWCTVLTLVFMQKTDDFSLPLAECSHVHS